MIHGQMFRDGAFRVTALIWNSMLDHCEYYMGSILVEFRATNFGKLFLGALCCLL